MLFTLKLLLPALLPWWRFFDFIAPSPRIQYAFLVAGDETPEKWCEFRPRPLRLSFLQMLGRLFWNQGWNESLFLVSCAERLLENPTSHSEDEILKRIISDLAKNNVGPDLKSASHLQFRLLLVQRKSNEIEQAVVFESRTQALPSPDVSWALKPPLGWLKY